MQQRLSYLFLAISALYFFVPLPAAAQNAAPQADGNRTDIRNGAAANAVPGAVESSADVKKTEPAKPEEKEPPPSLDVPPSSSPGAAPGAAVTLPLSALSGEPNQEEKKAVIDIGGLPIAELLVNDSGFSGLGSFRQLLPKYGISTYLHGVAIGRFNAQSAPEVSLLNVDGFSNSPVFGAEFNVFLGAELLNRVFAEVQFFYGSETNNLAIDYAQLDLRIFRDFLFVRGGRFRVPLGNTNSYPDPRYTFKLPILPLFFFQVVPGEWEELGFEIYGRYSWGEGRGLSYAFYVVNGLEQRVGQIGDPITGGAITRMIDNYLDSNDPDKAVGLQLQIEPIPGLSLGVSGYEGVYTVSGKHRLYIADTHLGFSRGKFTLRGELAATFQETEADTLLKLGGYVLASYRVLRYLEPVVMFDGFRLDGSHDLDRLAVTAGITFYPFPQKVPSASIRFAYSASFRESGEFANNRVVLQAQVAF